MSEINRTKEDELSLEFLKSLLNYDEATGLFTWIKNMAPKAKAGQVAGSICKDGYRHIKLKGTAYKAHRLAWLYFYGEWPEGEIDHRFRDKDDNRIATLRIVTPSENSINRGIRKDNTSGYKGVSWSKKTKKWGAEITANGNRIFLGYFETAELASDVYMKAAKNLHGKIVRQGK